MIPISPEVYIDLLVALTGMTKAEAIKHIDKLYLERHGETREQARLKRMSYDWTDWMPLIKYVGSNKE